MSGVLHELGRYGRIARQYARMGVRRRSQFRVEFVSQVVMDCFWYATKIGVFEVLYQFADDIASWRASDIRVFLGYLFVVDAFMMMWLGRRWAFGRELKDGKLDPFRVRPASTIFLYFFQQFSLEAVFNMAVASSYLAFGLARAGMLADPAAWPRIAFGILLGWWAIVVVTITFSVIEFWVVNSDLSMFLTHAFDIAGSNPIDVFSRHVRQFLLFVVPVGIICYVPASFALGRISWLGALGHAAWMIAFGLLAARLWTASFRRYESAMS